MAVHRELVKNGGRSIEDFCRLAADTFELLRPVEQELGQFDDSEHNLPLPAVERAYAAMSKRVPGLYLVAFEEGYRTGIDYRALAKTAPPEVGPLLKAMSGFERVAEGGGSWLVMTTDYSGCHSPEQARKPLAALVDAWSAAPSCLREAGRAHLSEALERMADHSCFCGEREPTLAAARKNARLIRSLTGMPGAALADRLLQKARAPNARFNCSP